MGYRDFFLFSFLLIVNAAVFQPTVAVAELQNDVAAVQGSIIFSPPIFYAGDTVRLYGTIINAGSGDISGQVGFFQGPIPIGEFQPFSLKARGAQEEFWTDWVVQEGIYNILMKVVHTTPVDGNESNNAIFTPFMTVIKRPLPVVVVPRTSVSSSPSSLSSLQPPTVKKQQTSSIVVKTPVVKQPLTKISEKSLPLFQQEESSSQLASPQDSPQSSSSLEEAAPSEPLKGEEIPFYSASEEKEGKEVGAPQKGRAALFIGIGIGVSLISALAGLFFLSRARREE